MIAYEFYWVDKKGEDHFFAILPERRKNPERITEKSIMKWGRMVLGDDVDKNSIIFKQITMDNTTGRIFEVNMPFDD